MSHTKKTSTLSDLKKGWKTVFFWLGKYKKEVKVLVALGLVSALANGSIPYLTGLFFDSLLALDQKMFISSLAVPKWAFFLSVWTILQITANAVDWISERKSRFISTYILAEYDAEEFSKILTMPMSFHTNKRFGETADAVQKAGNAISTIVERVIINLAPQMLSVVVGITIAMFINPYLASILLLGIIFYIASLVKIVPPIVKIQKVAHKNWGIAWTRAYDAIANVTTIKQSTAEKYEKEQIFNKFINLAAKSWFEVESIWNNISFYQRVVVALTMFLNFIVAVFFVSKGELSIGELVALTSYAMIIFGPFVQLGFNWQIIQNGLVAIDRSEKLLSITPEIYTPKNVLSLKDFEGKIVFDNVSFSYKEGKKQEAILQNISFEVLPGDVVALVGESGVGKSTLINLLMGYYFPTKGRVLVDDKNINRLDLIDWRQKIALVPQEVVLFNGTIEENIRYGSFRSSKKEVTEAARMANADQFIEKFTKKYKQLVGERGVKLSVGQKQRVAIARAILRNPKILILDEPTSALDIATEKTITASLEQLMEGRTTFIIAHRLSTVRRANKIMVFDKGKIVESGTHQELIKKEGGVYQKMHKMDLWLQ